MKRILVLFFAVALVLNANAQEVSATYDPDVDGDNNIGVTDLLALLSLFSENDLDDDGIWDSYDECLGEYDACGICGGTGEDADNDGLCDDLDDCIGDFDECGVCNGPGPNISVIDEILYETDSVFIELLGDWYTFEYPTDTLFTFVCPISGCTDASACNYSSEATNEDGSCNYPNPGYDCDGNCLADVDVDGVCDVEEIAGCQDIMACNYNQLATDEGDCVFAMGCEECSGETDGTGTVISYYAVMDGYTYDLVAIGDQCWFAENLRTEHYANGDAIDANLSDSWWASTTSGAVAVYGEDAGCENYSPDGDACDPDWSLNEYGRLYNWYAVDDDRGLCPNGWHVPTDVEWVIMFDFLVGPSTAWPVAEEMKTTYGWYNGNNGSNSSGFSGLPGGWRVEGVQDGGFGDAGNGAFWWSSSDHNQLGYAWYFGVEGEFPSVSSFGYDSNAGFSVRCLKDAD